MKRIWIFGICLLLATSAFAGQITKKWTFSAGSTIESAKVNEDFDDLYTVINGNIEGGTSGNIAADTLTEREMADDINPRLRDGEWMVDFTDTGLQPATSASLTSNISAGTAYVEGYRVNKASSTSHTYTNTKTTYVDISKTGVFTYAETIIGAAAPALTANSTRLAAVEANGAALTNVTDMRTLNPYSPYSPAGTVVQVVNTLVVTSTTGTNDIPSGGDAIPQNTDGDEYMTLAITPTSATNKLKIEVEGNFAHDNPDTQFCMALFQDSTANALACSVQGGSSAASMNLHITYYMTAGTTSATTFKVRAGGNDGSTTTLNGISGGRAYGGVLTSSITITEIKV